MTTADRPKQIWTWMRIIPGIGACALLIFLIGVGRLVAITGHTPLLAYANNYDQIRAMSLLGLSPEDPVVKFGEQSMGRPIRYFVQDRPSERIHYSSEEELLRSALWLQQALAGTDGKVARFDVKWKGRLEAALVTGFGLVMLACFYRLRRGYALTFALIFALWCDPVNSLFANTLYPEFFAAASLFFALAGYAHAALTRSASRGGFYFGSVMLLLFALAKPQYALAPLVVLMAMPLLERFRNAALMGLVAAIAVVSGAALLWADTQPWMQLPKLANRVNVVFDTVLPSMDDPAQGLRDLGLPSSCGAFVGKNWYSDDERVQNEIRAACAEVAAVDLRRIAAAVLLHPESIGRLVTAGVDHSRPYFARLLGQIGGGDFAKLTSLRGLQNRSIADVVDQASIELFGSYVAACVLIGGGALWLAQRRRETGYVFLIALCLGFVVYAFVTSLFGDGLFDMARHNFLNQTLLPCMALLCGAIVLNGALGRSAEDSLQAMVKGR